MTTVTFARNPGESGAVKTVTCGDWFEEDGDDFFLAAFSDPTPKTTTPKTTTPKTTSKPTATYSRSTRTGRRACITDGNCSSFTGHNCGAHNCDAN